MLSKMEVITDNATLNISAHQKPSTLIPSVNLSAKRIINALITNENNPKVRMVIGKESKDKIGLTIRLSKPKTTAKIMAEVKSATCTPLRIFGKKYATIAVIRSLIMTFIVFYNLRYGFSGFYFYFFDFGDEPIFYLDDEVISYQYHFRDKYHPNKYKT